MNNNPETVSTDYDTGDRLYFEPLCPEDVMDIIAVEKPVGVVVAFGGQTAIRLTRYLDEKRIPILGTSAEGIDTAEDRERFDALLEKFGIRRPRGLSALTLEEALDAARQLEYPVLLRPSYVIGGQNMRIVRSDDEVRRYMQRILAGGIENPVLIDQYMPGTELEVDVISDGTDVLIPGVMQHIERAGVHSGDSIAVYPPYNLSDMMMDQVVDCSRKLALALGTKGLVNIQYLIWKNELYVIEVNPRASRTVPYISKVTGVPMVDLAAKVMTGTPLKELGFGDGLWPAPPYVAVKVPVFSFEKLNDVNAYLGPEMKSTGEVLGIGKDLREALFKGLAAAGANIIIAGLMEEEFPKAEAAVRAKGVSCTVLKADISREEDVLRLAEQAWEIFPNGLDILVNNAGVNKLAPAEEMPLEVWQKVVGVNLTGTFLMCRTFGNRMLQQGHGNIVNVASMSGLVVNPLPQQQCAYNSSKAGVIMLTKCMANEWAQRGVRVNAICPGFTDTPLTARRLSTPNDPAVAKWIGGTPMGRVAQPDEMVGLVLYFASDASTFTTGAVLSVDGGYTCL